MSARPRPGFRTGRDRLLQLNGEESSGGFPKPSAILFRAAPAGDCTAPAKAWAEIFSGGGLPDCFLAPLAAAVVPGIGRDRLLRLNGEEDSSGFPVQFNDGDTGETGGHPRLFDEPLLDALNDVVDLMRSPQSLAYLLEAAGAVALEHCGAILDSRGLRGSAVEPPLPASPPHRAGERGIYLLLGETPSKVTPSAAKSPGGRFEAVHPPDPSLRSG